MGNSVISAKKLSVGYSKKIIVDELEFDVMAGEVLTLIGPNGAGKSTILKSVSAQIPTIEGKIYIDGRQLADMNERDISKLLSLLLTERIHSERMTCEDIVSTGRYPYTDRLGLLSKTDKKIVAEAMKLTSVEYLKDLNFRHISDGQRQCVMLARAIAQQPKVMVLDEPTSFLDISNKLKLLTLLRNLAKEKNIAVIQSLHELDLAQKFSDKVLCINDGKAEKYGEPEKIFNDDYISNLYGIDTGSYDTMYGSAEPKRGDDEPKVFVIGGGGKGIPIYRKFQRQGIPFAAGVIHENDLDYPIARRLASKLITESAFEPIGNDSVRNAISVMKTCSKVICCLDSFGSMNKGNELILKAAVAENKNLST